MAQQPWLHEFEIAVDGPSTALSAHDGQMGAPGTGWFLDDRRLLSRLDLRLDGEPLTAVAADSAGPRTDVWAVARQLSGPTPDPVVQVHRERRLEDAVLTETITVVSRSAEPVSATLTLACGGDGAALAAVKGGLADDLPPLPVHVDGDDVGWDDEHHRTTVTAAPAPTDLDHGTEGALLSWPVRLAPHSATTLEVTVTAHRGAASAFDTRPGRLDLASVRLQADPRWDLATRTNLADVAHLAQTDPAAPDDVFLAAGTPWYLTLFGRDALWSARFLLPFAPGLALGTLRTLARRQATTEDPATGAEPGKILHEVRRGTFGEGEITLPPTYYGTVDATPLWVCLLHDTWRFGLPTEDVRPFLPTLRAALGWMERSAARADGLLSYLDSSGHGLTNQGWKDSGDAMRRADGTVAPAPIALLEAQGYAVEAARGAARLLEALGEPGAGSWRDWADALSARVRDRFWVGSGDDAYLAMALDGQGRPVDGVGSNMGHVLETGLLTPEESDHVVRRLLRPDLLTPFGIATLSSGNPAYNPLGYHTGSVWTHDTAIALRGLTATGHRAEADTVIEALLHLAQSVDGRFPELTSGEPLGSTAVPYPASCRPQAWSAATAAVLMTAAVGLRVDVPAGVVSCDPSPSLPRGWSLRGVQVTGEELALGDDGSRTTS
ncbi:glycogen debranching N-terminal domain-containing protein [uncultured Serinicoccus sp.]|uniref:glycogen debranching N-terminal domain-containing protein n=1 Tax=uncultured Serinicoccus sp. TaxID=735514 RepID=UPI0026175F05|nr:glycogen debranching N-terminal domain-containing protein [uncultured Serinicoccus sp.]